MDAIAQHRQPPTEVHTDEKKTPQIVTLEPPNLNPTTSPPSRSLTTHLRTTWQVFIKLSKFVGPGTLISVAYIDPDNYQTDIASGVSYKYKLLFIILVSNLVAIFLQALSVQLGSVTGLDLAQMNRAHLPRWLNFALWGLAEAAIVCTDVGQVIGTAIAINLLNPRIPVVAGCVLSILDTLVILLFYRPDGSMKGLRAFEIFVGFIVLGVVICFCILLSLIPDTTTAGEVFKGFVPSKEIFQSQGLYQSCAILGGTIMPHTIYLGSGIVQARLKEFDVRSGSYMEYAPSATLSTLKFYRPSLAAIRSCLKYSIAELIITLFVVAMFVNSAILIVAAASLSDEAADADLYGMYYLFVENISQGAATLFALALLFSGTSAGIIATMAGQMVCEGAMNWRMSPFLRRLLTRSIAMIPGLVIAAAVGRKGLSAALEATNIVLSIALIFLTAPLVWYTCRDKYMMVRLRDASERREGEEENVDREVEMQGEDKVSLANGWFVTIIAIAVWLLIVVLNVSLFVLMGIGEIDVD